MTKSIYAILILIFIYSCEKENITKSGCNTDAEELLFDQIGIEMSYMDVESIMGSQGYKFRTDQNGSSIIEFYRWVYCNDPSVKIETWLKDNVIMLKEKSFRNSSCTNQVNNTVFNNIAVGNSYSTVKSYFFNDVGDKFRTDYTYYTSDTVTTDFYRWFDCTDDTKFIEVWFDNNEVRLATKNF